MRLSDLYTYTLYEVKNNDLKYVDDFESVEDLAKELGTSKRTIQNQTFKPNEWEQIDLEKYGTFNKYLIVKETSEELAEIITSEGVA